MRPGMRGGRECKKIEPQGFGRRLLSARRWQTRRAIQGRQAVLATVASVWEKLANQRGYQRVSRHMVDLVYRLDATPATRAALVPVGSARDRR